MPIRLANNNKFNRIKFKFISSLTMVDKLSVILAILFFADVSLCKLFPLDGKVINGTVALITGNEHQISLRLRNNDWYFGSGFICGGSVIAKNAVLTAAHCLWE